MFQIDLPSNSSPRGIVIDETNQRLYISDANNHRIVSYQLMTNQSSIIAGGNGRGMNRTQLNDPRGLYFDSLTNSLLIANAGAHNIVQWAIGESNWTLVVGSVNGMSGNDSKSLYGPWDVTLDRFRNVYVVDRYNSRVQFFLFGQTNGTTIAGKTDVMGSSAATFDTPLSIALDSQLNVYIADAWNHRIQLFKRY